MSKIAITVDSKEIENAIQKLDDREKWKIAQQIITKQFQSTVNKFRQRIKRKKLTAKKLNQIVEKARGKFYESRHRH